MGLQEPQFNDAGKAREYLEAKLWPSGPFCPHCGVTEDIAKLESRPGTKNKLRAGVYKCRGCRKQFTVTVGTIFEDSHIPLHKWLFAMRLMCSSKKGVSALQLQRELWGEDEETKKPKGSYRTRVVYVPSHPLGDDAIASGRCRKARRTIWRGRG